MFRFLKRIFQTAEIIDTLHSLLIWVCPMIGGSFVYFYSVAKHLPTSQTILSGLGAFVLLLVICVIIGCWYNFRYSMRSLPSFAQINDKIHRVKFFKSEMEQHKNLQWSLVLKFYDQIKNWRDKADRDSLEQEFNIQERRGWSDNRSLTPQDIQEMRGFLHACEQHLYGLQKGQP